MTVFKALGLALLLTLALSACANLSTESGGIDSRQLAVQYATLKVIAGSDTIDKELVLSRVETARQVLDGGQLVSIDDILSQVISTSEWDGLDPLDRDYLTLLLLQVESASFDAEIPLGEESVLRLLTVLEWIEEAARRASPISE